LLIRVETVLCKMHSISWIQIWKTSFLWLTFTSRTNSKKWSKYATRVIYGLTIFFLKKINNTMNEGICNTIYQKCTQVPSTKKIGCRNIFFHPTVYNEVIHWMLSVCNTVIELIHFQEMHLSLIYRILVLCEI